MYQPHWSRVPGHLSHFIVMFVILSCGGGQKVNGLNPIEPGLFMFPTARAYDGVGTVFAIDRQGVRQPALDVRKEVDTSRIGQEYLPDVVTYRRMEVSANGSLFFLTATFADTVRDSTVVHIGRGWREQLLWGDQQLAVELAQRQLKFLPEYRFFLITETVLADSIRYMTTSTAIRDMGGEASAKAKLGARGQLKRAEGRNYSLIVQLAPPPKTFRVAYKAVELRPVYNKGIQLELAYVDTVRVKRDPRFTERQD